MEVNRIKEALRPKLIAFQRECFAVLWAHFNPGPTAALPPPDDPTADEDAMEDDAAESDVFDIADTPDRSMGVKIAMIREARLIGGRDAAKRLWRTLGLPDLDDPAAGGAALPGAAGDGVALFVAERLIDAHGVRMRSDDVWRAYLDWAGRRGGDVVGRKTFGLAMGRRFRAVKANVIWYCDVAFRPDGAA